MDVRIGNGFGVEPFDLIPPWEPGIGRDQLGLGQAVRHYAFTNVGVLDGEVEAAGSSHEIHSGEGQDL